MTFEDTRPFGSRRPKWGIIAGAIAVVVLLFLLIQHFRPGPSANAPGTTAGGGTQATPPVPVSVMTAQLGVMSRTVPVVGQLQSDNHDTITAKIAGKLQRLLVSTGDHVQAGQLVAELDNTDALSGVRQAQAGLANAQAHLDQTRAGVGMKNTQTSQAITQANANLASAKDKLSQTMLSARITTTQASTDVQQAQAALASAQQNYAQVVAGSREQEKAQAHIAVARAQADFIHAKDNYTRFQSLFDQGAVSQQQRDDAKYSMDVYQAALDNAKQQESLVQAGSRSEQVQMAAAQVRQSQAALKLAQAQVARQAMGQQDVLQAQQQVRQMQAALQIAQAGTAQYEMTQQDVQAAAAQVRQAQAQLAMADEQLADTKIYSPVNGIVDSRPATLGGSVTPTTTILTIAPTRGLYFAAQVPEDAFSSVHVGQAVATTVDALPGRTLQGRISEIIPVASSGSKLYEVHVALPNDSGALPTNGFARGSIVVSEIHGVIIAKEALLNTLGDFYVWVAQNDHAARRDVSVGVTDDVKAQILKGLQPGDQYIVNGKDSVTEGAAVTVSPDPRTAAMS